MCIRDSRHTYPGAEILAGVEVADVAHGIGAPGAKGAGGGLSLIHISEPTRPY